MMRRREFIVGLAGTAATWPPAALAQQPNRLQRISVLMSFAESDSEAQSWVRALLQGLAELNWIDGRNVRIDVHFGAGDESRRSTLARDLVASNPEVIVTGGTPATAGIWRQTHAVPTIFVQIADPVALGLFDSFAHPGGNVTGFTIFEYKMGEKWLQVLREIAPDFTRIAVLLDTENPSWPLYVRAIEPAAASLGLQMTKATMHEAAEIERALSAFVLKPDGALIVLPSPASQFHRELIIGLAARYRLPAIYPYRFHAASGGLISYGVNVADLYHRAASYVDRVLRGENPGELPVQAPTKYELVINLKTAKALGLNIPRTLLVFADEVID